MESKMKKEKPTYEEKLQALKESIVHWEEVAEDPENADISSGECACCQMNDTCYVCPIFEKTKETGCSGTPFDDFVHNRTKENALAEVVFLKNLLIEMLEKGTPRNFCVDCQHWTDTGCDIFDEKCPHRPEEEKKKKKEWVDVTEEIDWEVYRFSATDHFWLMGTHDEKEIVYFSRDGLYFNHKDYEEDYKIETQMEDEFRILKKV